MPTPPVDALKAALETEAAELASVRDRLRAELEDVEAQLDARRQAAASLALIRPVAAPQAVAEAVVEAVEEAAPAAEEAPAPRRRAAKAKPAAKAPAGKAAPKGRAARKSAKPGAAKAERRVRTNLRDDIADVLNGSGEPMNVRQITEALGEEPTKSRLESVRTSVEGLVKLGRATKPSRGLFGGAPQA